MVGLCKVCQWTGIFISACFLALLKVIFGRNFYRRNCRKRAGRDRGDLERGRLSASNQAIAEDGDEDIIFERKPRERKEKNKNEDEGGKPNVSLKWKGLEIQDDKESEKDNGKQTANKKITLFTSDVGKIISSFYHGVCSQIIRKLSKTKAHFYRQIRLYSPCQESFHRQFQRNR